MNFLFSHILSVVLFTPTLAALVIVFLPKNRLNLIRWMALGSALLVFLLTLLTWAFYNTFNPAGTGFALVEKSVWYPGIGASFKLGLDGIGLSMVLLTGLLTPLAILASFGIADRLKAYMALFLVLETGMLGVFMSLDLMLFFVFWEIGLVPMYFLISQWGGANRNYASLKFILYTMGGSLGLLLAIQLIGVMTGTYDLEQLFKLWPTLAAGGTMMGMPVATVKSIAFWAFVIAFAVKVPVWPFHTWLPDAHTEAPTAGSMILAGVLLKLGAFGFIRLVLPLFPAESHQYAGWLVVFATLAIIFGAWGAFGQDDFKRLVAYSSINHMGFVVLGIAAAAVQQPLSQNGIIALNGAVLQMFNHGLYSAGMFFLVGVIYERAHTRDLNAFGGLYAILPVYGTILIFTSMASLGLPGLNGFVSEFMVVRGAWAVFPAATALSMIGLFFTGAYTLKALWKVLHGPVNPNWSSEHGHDSVKTKGKGPVVHAHILSEINARELLVITPLMILILVIGIWPSWIVDMINKAVMSLGRY
jgi:NADH-quinone oxidoreductase subunit M